MSIVNDPNTWVADPTVVKPTPAAGSLRAEINKVLKTFIDPSGAWDNAKYPALLHAELDKIFPGTNSDTI